MRDLVAEYRGELRLILKDLEYIVVNNDRTVWVGPGVKASLYDYGKPERNLGWTDSSRVMR